MRLRYELIPPEWDELFAEILTAGAERGKPDDFSAKTEDEYYRSAMGHLIADRKGIHVDPDDGFPSLVKVALCLLIAHTKRNSKQ